MLPKIYRFRAIVFHFLCPCNVLYLLVLSTIITPSTAATLLTVTEPVHSLDSIPANSLPQPWLDRDAVCRPLSPTRGIKPTASVCDPTGLLSEREIKQLNQKLAQIYGARSPFSLVRCPPGHKLASDATGFRVAFVVVRRLPADKLSLAERTQLYAHTLFSRWALRGNCGASVLLLVSLEDRRLYVETGALASAYVTEGRIDDIFNAMANELATGNLYRALDVAADRIGNYLKQYDNGSKNLPQQQNGVTSKNRPFGPLYWRNGPDWWDFELSLVLIFGAVCVCCACCNGLGGPDAARARRERSQLLRKLDVVRTEYICAALPQYEPATCPICQNSLSGPHEPTESVMPVQRSSTSPNENQGDPLTASSTELTPQSEGDENENNNNENTSNADNSNEGQRPTRRFRCGHVFHDGCLHALPAAAGNSSRCPVCGDTPGVGNEPRPLSETRGEDFTFRIGKLRNEFPHILAPDVYERLVSSSPTMWPDTLDDTFLKPVNSTANRNRGGGGGGFFGNVGGMLAAGGIGAIIGSVLSGGGGGGGGGGGSRNQGYQNIGGNDGGGWVGQHSEAGGGGGHGGQFGIGSWFGQHSTGGGGHGGQFGQQSGNGNQSGHGAGWGSSNVGPNSGWSGGSAHNTGGHHGAGGHGAGW